LNVNFSIWKDSTTLEHQIRAVLLPDFEHDRSSCLLMPVFVNCMSFMNEWQTCEDKLWHELQFDQIINYGSNTMIGFGILFNFFSRIMVHKKEPACLLTLTRKEVYPWERTNNHILLRFAKMCYFPLSYHTLMERVNSMHFGVNRFTEEVGRTAQIGYPQLKSLRIEID